MFISRLFWLAREVSWLTGGCRSTLSMSKIKVKISETKFLSCCKTLRVLVLASELSSLRLSAVVHSAGVFKVLIFLKSLEEISSKGGGANRSLILNISYVEFGIFDRMEKTA